MDDAQREHMSLLKDYFTKSMLLAVEELIRNIFAIRRQRKIDAQLRQLRGIWGLKSQDQGNTQGQNDVVDINLFKRFA